jgi:putative ABC transport system permease protein
VEYDSGDVIKDALMNSNAPIQPPRWAQRLLEWYCKPELLEDLQGDLHEYFDRHCKRKGPRMAKVIYVIDVLKFFRLYTIKKPQILNLLMNWLMIGSYIKTSGRSIVRNKLFSTINIVGLAISMSVGLLMISFLADLLSYDKFHAQGDRIYRIITHDHRHDNRTIHVASTSVNLGKKVQQSFTGIENSVILTKGFTGDVVAGESITSIDGMWSTESFFSIFSFPLIEGDPRTALKEANSVVLTEITAKKLFGNSDGLGKTIQFISNSDTSEYTVTGIMQDIPKFSQMQFGALCSFATLEETKKNEEEFLMWENVWMNYVYVLMPEKGANLDQLQANLNKVSEEGNKNLNNREITFSIQRFYDVALGEDLSNPIGPTMMQLVVYILGGLAFIVILSACFNYTNLSIARSLRRSKEVGIRKVIGAFRNHVLFQFIVESVLVSLFALLFSFVLFIFLRDQFLGLAPEITNIVELNLSFKIVAAFIVFAILVGILAGFLPAIFFSKVNAVKVLKDVTTVKAFRNINMRKALIVVQYCFSLMFITATVIGYKQYKHMLAFDLGFNTSNVLNIELQGNKSDVAMKELSELKEVEMMSRSMMVTSVGSYWGSDMKYTDPMDSATVWYNTIDENYLPLHGHKLLAGRNFSPRTGTFEESEVIVNEQVLKRFNIAGGDPVKALGEQLTMEKKKLTIIAVMKDFHYGKVDNTIDPVVFRYSNDLNSVINAKINSEDWPGTLKAVEAKWKQIDRIHPLKATFYDDQIQRAYSQFSVMTKVIGFLAFLAISIASMGLFGMVVFTTETRLKEISIRKVLGASEGKLIIILSKSFIILLLVSGFIALPLTYILFDKVVLAEIVYHAPLSIADFLVGIVAVMGVALLMIGSQTLKVARTNPADVLKTE